MGVLFLLTMLAAYYNICLPLEYEMKTRSKHPLLEEMAILLIMPVTFVALFLQFGFLQESQIGIISMILSSGVLYYVTRWLWFDSKNRLGVGIDEYMRKNGGKYRN